MGHHASPWWENWANCWPETVQGTIANAAANTQLALLPIYPPMNGRSRLLNFHFSNATASAAVIVLWDQLLVDPTNYTTNGTRGSHTAPILQFNIPAGADAMGRAVTTPYFQCGVAAQSSQSGVFFSLELVHQALG
jgi:hypothetical protein